MKVTETEILETDAIAAKILSTMAIEKRLIPIIFPNDDKEESAELHNSKNGQEKITWPTLYSGTPRGGLPLRLQTGDHVFWSFEEGQVHIKGLLRVPEGTKPVHRTFFIYVAERFFANGLPEPYFLGWNDSLARSSALLFNPNHLPLTSWDDYPRCSLKKGHPTANQSTLFARQLASITDAFNSALSPCPHVNVDQIRTVMSDDSSWLKFVDKHYTPRDLANRLCSGTAECTTSYHDFEKGWLIIRSLSEKPSYMIFAPNILPYPRDLVQHAKTLKVKSIDVY